MLTLNDIINASFRKSNFSGYRTDDVDNFIDQVKDSYDSLIRKNVEQKEANERLAEDVEQLQKKLEVLAGKIEEYRNEEGEIKDALISAQKLGDASIREARHKAEIIIKDANMKAQRILSNADEDLISQSRDFEKLKQTISDFRSKLLSTYKEHLTLIDALPSKPETASIKNEKSMSATNLEQEQSEQEQPEQEQPEQVIPDEDVDIPVDFPSEAASNDEVGGENDRFDDPLFSSQATQSFHLDVSNFDTELDLDAATKHDMRYDVLKFDGNHDITDEKDSPVGIFNRNK